MSEVPTGVEEPPATKTAPQADPGAPRRGSALAACGLVVGIAVLAVAGIVGWARLGGAGGPVEPPGVDPVDEAVPDSLAGGIELGEVPDAVAAAFDGSVVAARLLDEPPDGVDCSFMAAEFGGDVEVEQVLATPDAVHVSLLGTGGPAGPDMPGGRFRATCSARWQGGWLDSGGSMGPADQPATGMTGTSCCDEDGLATAEGAVAAPDGATFAVQARGDWHLAYPVPDSGVVPISWRFREGRGGFAGGPPRPAPTTVTFVDDRGEVLDEVTLRP